ncbi:MULTISPECIES: S8 family serine peptidase [Streptomyces]|uniref:Serine protease n=1 Tax=Streptomyces canarius TaxID=285453 RepID=A0ABQ3D8J5_9ACTN|nr:S8 family serine peptidase [Streptomyces canarius]GHA65805.1 serine protease [Streptomyces canarius]
MRRPSGYLAVAIGIALALTSGLAGGAAAAPPGGAQSAGGTGMAKASKTVTLITGDRVMVDATGQVTGVERAKGRERVPFSVRKVAGHIRVVPGDAELLLADGTLDARLFDVTQLVADGYDDAHRSDLPLIVTFRHGKERSMSTFTPAGAEIDRALPVIDGAAMHTVKKHGAEFWDAVTGARTDASARAGAEFTASTAVEKVWLDGKRRGTLDRSVPQIGAPAAWAAGYDGTGVKVAVLDTGVDKTHPDLAGQVIAEQDFSGSADTSDHFGHGTHAASIVAGTGAKSGGTYKGVAPGAKILNGKVLNDNNLGEESGIIAGMEWAVAQGADVVNLSLGGEDTPGIDPMEEAVNRLSAETDTLFVIAAGNDGKGEHTVDSPGSAEAALTVGAVDKSDQLAGFSSRGPRVGDSGVKPDLTAPGVAITAASAPGSRLENSYPSDIPGYITLDGTSMATPHVAGAAALLAQQHPDWDGERLKAVLTGSAEPGAYSSFQQGTGRTDVARAIKQSVITEQGPLDFGRQEWPHDDDKPVTKQLTYRNLGTQPVTLDLSVDALSVNGKPAAEGMFTVSPQRVTVPAGGEASATVTADTRAGSTDGTFGGSVSATSADDKVSVRTAVGVEREVEMHDLTLKHIDENGRPTGDAVTEVQGVDTDFHASYADEEDGELTVRLPKGDYSLSGMIHPGFDSATHALVFQPRMRLDADTTVTIDARQTRPVQVTLPDPAAKNIDAAVAVGWRRGDGLDDGLVNYGFPGFQSFTVGQLGSDLPADQAFAQYSGTWSHQDAGTPVNYHLAWKRTGQLDGFNIAVARKQLATVDVLVGSPATGKKADILAQTLAPSGEFTSLGSPVTVDLPLRGTDYVLGDNIKWNFIVLPGDGPDAQLWSTRTYQAGKRYTERFNVGVFGPALGGTDTTPSAFTPGIARNGNVISAYLPQFNDGAGHWNTIAGAPAETSLQADGREISDPHGVSPTDDVATYTVPAQDSAYKLTLDTSRDPASTPVSTRVRTEWTFRSGETPEGAWSALPLSVVRFYPELTLASTAKAGQQFDVPFRIEGAAAGQQPKKLAFEVSYDEGNTWQAAEAVGGTHLSLKHPAAAGSVSLRAKLTDAQGNTLVQTIERAYLTTQ